MQVYEGKGTQAHDRLERYRDKKVPGLDDTFRDVFKAIEEEGPCPLWLVGGSVRDLVAGLPPNDFDCIALCNLSDIMSVADRHGWRSGQIGMHFSIGDVHSGDSNYLEGFDAEQLFTNYLLPEMTTAILLWSLSTDKVIDPTGTGIHDAQHMLLRPAAPLDPGMPPDDKALWDRRQQWLSNGLDAPWLARHVRYLKMRMRGWKPADDCVRLFMANTIDAMVWVERPGADKKKAFGQGWPFATAATMSYFQFNACKRRRTPEEEEPECSKALTLLWMVYMADFQLYLKGEIDDKCSSQGDGFQPPLVRTAQSHFSQEERTWWGSHGPLCWSEVFMNGLVLQCEEMEGNRPSTYGVCLHVKKTKEHLASMFVPDKWGMDLECRGH